MVSIDMRTVGTSVVKIGDTKDCSRQVYIDRRITPVLRI